MIAYAADSCVMATWRNITLGVWAGEATVTLATQFANVADQAVAQSSSKLSSVHLIINDAPVPGAEARAVLDALAERHAARTACVATMIEGSGFRVSAMRSFLTGMLVLRRQPFKVKTCATIDEVANWMAERHTEDSGVAVTSDELRTVLSTLRAHPALRTRQNSLSP